MSSASGAPKVVFDASNLAVGGGVQVAASLAGQFIEMAREPEMLGEHPWLEDLVFFLSPEVRDNLVQKVDAHQLKVGRTGRSDSRAWLRKTAQPFDLHLAVFGPRYGPRLAPLTVVGIADVTSIFRRPKGVPSGSPTERVRRSLRGLISRAMFRRETFLVSESHGLIEEYRRRTGFPEGRTAVVPNALNQAVADPARREAFGVDLREGLRPGTLLMGYVTRAYPHKNLEFLAHLHSELRERGLDVKFVLTLSDEEWTKLSEDVRGASVNAGPILVSQVGNLFEQCDAAVFPSLLESFSAMPLEAMATVGLLFASDRWFVREVCGDAVVYFDPLDPEKAAGTIAQVLTNAELIDLYRTRAGRRVRELPDARGRAVAYAEIVTQALRHHGGSVW